MIPHYTDLSANERTYLAWMRTALALIAFGFLLERFDLMLRTFGKALTDGKVPINSPLGREAGLALVIFGLVIMILSSLRFVKTTRLIRRESSESYCIRSVMLTGGVFILLALFVLYYVSRLGS